MGEKMYSLNDANTIRSWTGMTLSLHLILKHKYYDAIDRGEKTVEYRDNTEFWRRRIVPKWNRIGGNKVVFHKGYTKVTMTFLIKDVIFNGDKIEIWLGERLK